MGEEERLGGRVQDVVPSFGAAIGTIKKSRHCLRRLWRDNFSHSNKPKTCGHGCGCKVENVRLGGSSRDTNESIVISRTNNNPNKIKTLLPVMLFSIILLYNITILVSVSLSCVGQFVTIWVWANVDVGTLTYNVIRSGLHSNLQNCYFMANMKTSIVLVKVRIHCPRGSRVETIQKRTLPWCCRFAATLAHGFGLANPLTPPPVASAEVVGQGRCCRPSSLAMFTASLTSEGDRLPTKTMNMNPWDLDLGCHHVQQENGRQTVRPTLQDMEMVFDGC